MSTTELLNAFLSSSPTQRANANRIFEEMALGTMLLTLVEALLIEASPENRQLCAILLRKKLIHSRDDCPDNIRAIAGKKVIQSLRAESDPSVRRRVIDLTTVMAGTLFAGNCLLWRDLWDFLQTTSTTEVAMNLIERLAEYPETRKMLNSAGEGLGQSFFDALKIDGDAGRAAFFAVTSLIDRLDETTPVLAHKLSTLSLAVIDHATSSLDVDVLLKLLAAVDSPGGDFFRREPALGHLLARMTEITRNVNYSKAIRESAVKVLTAALVKVQKPQSDLLGTSMALLAEIIAVEVNDSEEHLKFWCVQREDDHENEENSLDLIAWESMGRITKRMGKLNISSNALFLVEQQFQHPSWKQKFSAFLTLIWLAIDVPNQLSLKVESLELLSLQIAGDVNQHPKLRWAALSAMVELITVPKPSSYPDNLPVELFSRVARIVHKESIPRIQCRALQVLCHLIGSFADCPDLLELISPMIGPLVTEALEPVLSRSPYTQVQELALAALGCLASNLGHSFNQFYDSVTAVAWKILQEPTNESYSLPLVETAVELAGHLCGSSSDEQKARDVGRVADQLLRIYEESQQPGSRLQSYSINQSILLALSSMAGGSGFGSMLHRVFDLVSHLASQKVEHSLETQETVTRSSVGFTENEGRTQLVVVHPGLGIQQILSINTCGVEEKRMSFEILGSLAIVCEAQDPQLLSRIFDLCWCELSAEVTLESLRESSCEALSAGLSAMAESLRSQAINNLNNHFNLICRPKLSRFTAAFESSVPLVLAFVNKYRHTQDASYVLPTLEEAFRALWRVVEIFPKILSPSFVPSLIDSTFSKLGLLMLKTIEIETHKRGWSDEDDEEENVEGSIYDGVMQCCCWLLKSYGELCFPALEKYLEAPFGSLLSMPDMHCEGRTAALCLFATAIHYGGSAAVEKLAGRFAPIAVGCCTHDEDSMVLQAAAFGVGVVASRMSVVKFRLYLESAVFALDGILSHPDCNKSSRRLATDCAASGLLKICFRFGELRSRIVELLETRFPLMDDEEESQLCNDLLVEYLESGHASEIEAVGIRRVIRLAWEHENLMSTRSILNGRKIL